jgi:hypothetical protein
MLKHIVAPNETKMNCGERGRASLQEKKRKS